MTGRARRQSGTPPLLGLLGSALLVLSCQGCASDRARAGWRELRDTLEVAAPSALVAVALAPLGPVVEFGGVLLTTMVTRLFVETASLSSGEKQGEGAGDKEADRLRRELQAARGQLDLALHPPWWLSPWTWLKVLAGWGALLIGAHWLYVRRRGKAAGRVRALLSLGAARRT